MKPAGLGKLFFGLIALLQLLVTASQHLMNAGIARILNSGLLQHLNRLRILSLLVGCRARVIELIAYRVMAWQRAEAPDSGIKIALNEIYPAQVICRHTGGTLDREHLIE